MYLLYWNAILQYGKQKRPFRRQRPERAQDARKSEAHFGQGGVAVDGTVLLYAQAAEPVGKVQVLLQLFAGQLFQLVHRHAVPAQLPQEGADEAVARTEVAKMEVLATGKMTINENNLNLKVDYGVPTKNTGYKIDFGPDADIVGQIMAVADAAAESGNALTEIVTSTKILRKLAANKGIQTLIYGTVGAGTYVPAERIRSLFAELFGFGVITTNDLRYKTQTASGNEATKRFFPEDKMAFLCNGTSSSFGVGLWGVTPEEADYGQYNEKSANQFITITQWATPDPVAVWTKASGVFIPVVPNPNGLFIAADTSK